jgi:UrcA family protein
MVVDMAPSSNREENELSNFTDRMARMATFALVAFPIATLGATAHAQPSIQTSDLNLATAAGKAAFDHRTNHAAAEACGNERNLSIAYACKAAVRAEVTEKLAMIAPAAQFAGQRAIRTERSVQIADLNLATTAGKVTFDRRLNSAAERVCRDEKNLSIQHACKLAVRTEVTEKLSGISASTQLAAR